MQLTKNQLLIVGGSIVLVLIIILMVFGILPGFKGAKKPDKFSTPAEITIWGIEPESNLTEAIASYNTIRPNIKISYTEMNPDTYENNLINALASNNGPDIFYFHRSWLTKHITKIIPAPQEITTSGEVGNLFPSIITNDFVSENNVYSLPLYIDTLAMFYNKNILDSKGIAIVPKTWEEFEKIVPKLRVLTKSNEIIQPAAAIGGTSENIPKAFDLLSLIMMQSGSAIFSNGVFDYSNNIINALEYYIQFSDPNNSLYTWNSTLKNATDSFAEETLPIVFDYPSISKELESKNQYLNYNVAPMLQIDSQKPVNIGDYWGLSVSNQSKNSEIAWDFIKIMTTNETVSLNYLSKSGHFPALRSEIQKILDQGGTASIFASQALTAKNWQEVDMSFSQKIFDNMIQSVLTNKLLPSQAIDQVRSSLGNLISK